ncbi:MAG: hypothetical protein LC102_01100 [Ignavibacteriales bacterium]|nr:hypothetical protein [Oligoflexia bacterium]MCZ2142009.1 hypothetical protein [Ignavibacteriales bacterium]
MDQSHLSSEINQGILQKEKRGVVTARDGIACRLVCEQGVMTIDQLWRAVWWSEDSRSPRYVYDRVSFLVASQFLAKMRSPYSLKSYFRATRMGQELASTSGESSRLVPLATPRVSEIPHADGMTELRLMVSKAGKSVEWRPDRALAIDSMFPKERFYGIVPDAIWVTKTGKRIAVEYERTRKGVSRVRAKVEALSREVARQDRVIDRVLWIAEPGAYQDLEGVLSSHPSQTLRTMDQFRAELVTQELK